MHCTTNTAHVPNKLSLSACMQSSYAAASTVWQLAWHDAPQHRLKHSTVVVVIAAAWQNLLLLLCCTLSSCLLLFIILV